MSQSVKLSDGSYIDAGAVRDATQGKTQEEINNTAVTKFVPTGSDIGGYIADRCTMLKMKSMIIINFNVTTATSLDNTKTSINIINASDLGLSSFPGTAMNPVYVNRGSTAHDMTQAMCVKGGTVINVSCTTGKFSGAGFYGCLCIPIL